MGGRGRLSGGCDAVEEIIDDEALRCSSRTRREASRQQGVSPLGTQWR
jgi:hypothetical protein